MYVLCMYVCMYVCTYMYVCMYIHLTLICIHAHDVLLRSCLCVSMELRSWSPSPSERQTNRSGMNGATIRCNFTELSSPVCNSHLNCLSQTN